MLRLKEIRQEKGLKQLQLANLINVSIQTISGYETGYAQPPIDILIKIADALETTTDNLLGRTNDVGLVEIHNELTQDQQELLSLYNKMSFQDKNQLLGFAKALVY
mgnify:CR=1 FL=1